MSWVRIPRLSEEHPEPHGLNRSKAISPARGAAALESRKFRLFAVINPDAGRNRPPRRAGPILQALASGRRLVSAPSECCIIYDQSADRLRSIPFQADVAGIVLA